MFFFAGENSRKCLLDISRGGNFYDTTPVSFINLKGIWILFSREGNFYKEDKSTKNAKIIPTREFPRLQYVF